MHFLKGRCKNLLHAHLHYARVSSVLAPHKCNKAVYFLESYYACTLHNYNISKLIFSWVYNYYVSNFNRINKFLEPNFS